MLKILRNCGNYSRAYSRIKMSSTKSYSESSSSTNFVSADFKDDRLATAASIKDFEFKKERIRVLSQTQEVKVDCKGIVYWMSRDQRVQDNWAFLYAQKLAFKNEVPLHVCFCLVPKFLGAPIRHFQFMLTGLEEVAKECQQLDIPFHLLRGDAGNLIPAFVTENQIGGVVCDMSPLRVPTSWTESVKNNLPKNIPFYQVDAHNIVPVWVTSETQEYGARTIRSKVNNLLSTYLTPFPPVITHPYKSTLKAEPIDWNDALQSLEVDRTVEAVKWAKPGTKAGWDMLQSFVDKRLCMYKEKRNDPTINATSNLSPWLHFGQISVQRCILSVQEHKGKASESVAHFCEETIVRRELADNFCFYNKNYDSLLGCHEWSKKTLNDHRKDKREYLYSDEELDQGRTHDDLWNAAQIQLRVEGKMHGYMRMYWAKKILEWTATPEKAVAIAIHLNDHYSLDGRDPNGYLGCLSSICGLDDRPFDERKVYGKIRYMSYEGCKKKFDIMTYIYRFGEPQASP